MKHAGPTRRELGVRTAFNLLGPLTNPAGARRQIVGVSRPEHTELVARTLGALGTERAWVVHGAGGLDELSTLGHTKVSELRDGMVNTFYVHPADVGLPRATRHGSWRAATPPRTRRSIDACSTASADRAATSCCSTPRPGCSSPARVASLQDGVALAADQPRQRARRAARSTACGRSAAA